MAKKLNRGPKRRAKLGRRAERSRFRELSARADDKYRAEEYAPIYLAAERGVWESDVLLDQALNDDDVRWAIETLATELVMDVTPSPEARGPRDEKRDVITGRVRRNWSELFGGRRPPGHEDLIGVLGTLLASVESWRDPAEDARGYLRHLGDLMAEAD